MSSRKITLLSLIGILLTIYILQLTFDTKGKIKEIKPKTPVSKIEIINSKENIILEKKNNDWIVNSVHPANTDIADYVLASLDDIKIIDTVSKSGKKEDLQKYGFDKSISVSGYSFTGDLVQKISIGKTSTTGNQTYIQIGNKKEIYLVSGNLIIPFNLTEKDFLDYTLYSFKFNEVYKIEKFNGEIAEKNLEFAVEKTGEVAESKWNSSTLNINGAKIEEWLKSIESISAAEWIEDFENFDINSEPQFSFIISAAGRDIELKFFNVKNHSGLPVCICSESNNFPCYISPASAEKFNITISDLQ